MQQLITKDDELLSISELAKRLEVSTETLRRWERQGKIRSYRFTTNGKRRYKLSEVQHLIEPNPKGQNGRG